MDDELRRDTSDPAMQSPPLALVRATALLVQWMLHSRQAPEADASESTSGPAGGDGASPPVESQD